MAGPLGAGGFLPRAGPAGGAALLLPRDASLSVRAHPHGPCAELLHRRRGRPLLPAQRFHRDASHRMGRSRPAGRERGAPARGSPGRLDHAEHRPHAAPAPPARVQLRLGARVRHLRFVLLPLEPVVLRQDVGARARLPEERRRQLVPRLRNRARQRAGRGRGVLALRGGGRGAGTPPVVPARHRLRRRAARRDGADARLAAQGAGAAAQLDRALGRRGDPLPDPGAGRRGRRPGVHHPGRHHLWRDRTGARSPSCRGPGHRGPEPGGGRLRPHRRRPAPR